MALSLSVGKCTLLGNYRENNEDAIDVKVFPDMTVCLVADGMGGQAAGEVASKRAIEIVPREVKVAQLQGGDRFLLCTDGLSGVVADEQLLSFIKEKTDVQECADGLGQLALDAGSRDNVSCIVIEVIENK